jgi:hypothetical protein
MAVTNYGRFRAIMRSVGLESMVVEYSDYVTCATGTRKETLADFHQARPITYLAGIS